MTQARFSLVLRGSLRTREFYLRNLVLLLYLPQMHIDRCGKWARRLFLHCRQTHPAYEVAQVGLVGAVR